MFVLVYSESSFRGVEDDEHVVPGVGYDGAEAYLDLERTLDNLASGGSESRQGFGTESTTRSVSIGRSAWWSTSSALEPGSFRPAAFLLRQISSCPRFAE
jgi:hypothetical protein